MTYSEYIAALYDKRSLALGAREDARNAFLRRHHSLALRRNWSADPELGTLLRTYEEVDRAFDHADAAWLWAQGTTDAAWRAGVAP